MLSGDGKEAPPWLGLGEFLLAFRAHVVVVHLRRLGLLRLVFHLARMRPEAHQIVKIQCLVQLNESQNGMNDSLSSRG